MTAQVSSLANTMKAKKEQGQKFVLMLGAGASMSSGVKRTAVIMDELLQQFGQGIVGSSVEEKFDQLWRRNSDATRTIFVKSHLDHVPSVGYTKLARLVQAGYFDLALTFNFDDLLEKALRAIEFNDFEVIVRGDTVDEAMQKIVDRKEPRFKLAKLHGSLKSDQLLFTADEMFKYPEAIEAFVRRVTGNDIIVCGYGFNDMCVVRAFAEQGGSIVDVDRFAPPKNLRVFLKNRRSEDWAIKMDFDPFFTELHGALLEAHPADPRPEVNPFKFLQSYEKGDADSLTGREEDTTFFLDALKDHPQVIVVAGPGKAGKTSFVQAALQPKLDIKTYRPVYLRCQTDIEKSIPEGLKEVDETSQYLDLDLPASLELLTKRSGDRRTVLFLDQFERVTNGYDLTTAAGRKELGGFLRERLFKGCNNNLTLVLIVTDEGYVGVELEQNCRSAKIPVCLMVCRVFDRDSVKGIIKALAKMGGIEFDEAIVEDISKRFADTAGQNAERRFTLAHVQAVCHILAGTCRVDFDSYQRAFDNNLEALHQAINVCDIISFVEDFSESEAVWLRNIIKVPLKESKERIAGFIKLHYEELLPPGGRQPRRRPSHPRGLGTQA